VGSTKSGTDSSLHARARNAGTEVELELFHRGVSHLAATPEAKRLEKAREALRQSWNRPKPTPTPNSRPASLSSPACLQPTSQRSECVFALPLACLLFFFSFLFFNYIPFPTLSLWPILCCTYIHSFICLLIPYNSHLLVRLSFPFPLQHTNKQLHPPSPHDSTPSLVSILHSIGNFILAISLSRIITNIMKATTLVLSSLLASAVIAQPHHQHNARHHHNKRAETVVWVTDYVTEYTTVDTTTTVWVSEGYVAPTTSSSTPTPSPSSSSAEIPAQFFEGGNQPASSSTTLVASTSIYIAPVPVSTYTPLTTSEAPVAAAPAVAPTSTTEIPVYVAPADTPPAETSSAAAAPSSPASSGSSTGTCSSGSPCTGDITYYEAGLGACGLTTNGTIERVIALPHVLMGTLSNTNPYCGKTVTIKCIATGKTTTATVVDKCMGCEDYAIDLSNAAFEELEDLAVGRTTATWWFN